jgi:hypothetical protein
MSQPQELKQDARDARLSNIRKSKEEQLRKELQAAAREKCKEYSVAFGNCAKENGLMVVLRCRDQNFKANQCMNENFNEKLLAEYIENYKKSLIR